MYKDLAPIAHAVWKPPKRSPVSALHMVWRRRLVIVLTALLLSAVGAAIVRGLPAIYRAETVILVESQRIPERFVASTVSSELKDRLATLSQQILSYDKLLEVAQRFDLYRPERATHTQEEIVEMMRSDISIQLEQGWTARNRSENRPSAFRISYQGSNPELVALVANQLGGLFINENLKARELQAVGTSEFLGTQLAEAKKRLEEQEAKLSAYKLKFNGELPEQENMLLATLGQLQLRLQVAADAVTRAEQTKTIIEASISVAEDSDRAFSDLTTQTGGDGTIAVLGTQAQDKEQVTVEALKRRIEVAKAIWGENHPEMLTMRESLARLQREESGAPPEKTDLEKTQPTSAPKKTMTRSQLQLAESQMQRQERLKNMATQASVARDQIAAASAERVRIEKEIAKVQQRLSRIPIREQEMAVVKRDYEISREHYQSLLDKGMSADLAAQMELRQKAERFTVIEAARTPQKPVKPNRPLFYAMATFLSCVVGLAVGLGGEIRRNALLGEWDVPRGVPVLGRIPSIVTYNPVFDIQPQRRRRRWALILAIVLVGAATGAAWALGWIRALNARLHG